MTLQLTVPNMACDVCAKFISYAVLALDEKETVTSVPKTKQVDIETESAETAIREALETAGYPPAA